MKIDQASTGEVFIGLVFGFVNDNLGINWFGSPVEIVNAASEAGFIVKDVAHHLQSGITCRFVWKRPTNLSFHGGPHAKNLMGLMDALGARDHPLASAILENDRLVITGDHDGASVPLSVFVAFGDIEAVKLLLSHGATVDAVGGLGMTALHWAAACGSIESVQTLLDAGADPSRTNHFLLTPAQLAYANEHDDLGSLLAARFPVRFDGKAPLELLKQMGC